MRHFYKLSVFFCVFSAIVMAMPNRDAWRTHARDLLLNSPDILERDFPPPEKGMLVIFMKPGCPLANLYAPRLNQFSSQYGEKGIRVLGVLVSESDLELRTWTRERNLEFKVVKDTRALSDHFRAAVSPEAFILDGDFEMVYRGQIDDQYQPGRPNFRRPTHTPVQDRLAKLAAGELIDPSFTVAKGCFFSQKAISFNKEIAPLIYTRCTHCHRPGDIQSQIPLTNYQEIAEWAPTMAARMSERYMPPWRAHHQYGNFSNDVSLSVNEMWLFSRWVEEGLPSEPDPIEAPLALTGSTWRLGEPDLIVGMLPEGETYEVAAEGILPYQHFIVDSPFDQDTWVLATEVQPGTPEVVHHINVFILSREKENTFARILKRGGARKRLEARGQTVNPQSIGMVLDLYGYKLEKQIRFLSDFNPAESVTRFPKGKGLLLRKDDRIVFEVHYTPNGTVQQDRSLLAFEIAEQIPEDWESREPITHAAGHLGQIAIAPNTTKTLSLDIPIYLDADLHSLKPHMHYRGKHFRAELLLPNQTPQTLLYIPQWDYDFQLPYLFQKPVFMPRGSRLRLHYEWDNTTDNPFISEEQAKESVTFGFQTEDEMSMAFPTYTYRTQNIEEIREAERSVTQAIMNQVQLPRGPKAESDVP